MDDPARWEGAGLYDPAAPGAADRLALLRYLRDRGATLDEMVAYAGQGRLPALAGALVRREHRTRYAPGDLARLGVVDLDTYGRVFRAAGLPVLDPDEVGLTDLDADALASFVVSAEVFGEDEVLQFTRVIGAALASVADAATVLFGLTVGGQPSSTNAPETEYARAVEAGARLLVDVVPDVMRALFLQHVEAASGRYAAGVGDGGDARVAVLGVGFVDLVESTPMVHDLSADEIAAAITAFEQRATEVVAAHRGRVVKTMGDEVMFVTTTAPAAAEIAIELVAFAEGHPALRGVRGGLAWGRLVRGYADFYGPVVNLAARAATSAHPGEVLAERALVDQIVVAPDGAGIHVGVPRQVALRGFAEPVGLWPITRAEEAS